MSLEDVELAGPVCNTAQNYSKIRSCFKGNDAIADRKNRVTCSALVILTNKTPQADV